MDILYTYIDIQMSMTVNSFGKADVKHFTAFIMVQIYDKAMKATHFV